MTLMGYEQPVAMPSMGVYDTDLVKAYIAGVKEQYNLRLADFKDFLNKYSDFYSPVPGANEAFYNMTLKGAKDMMNYFYENGIDPFKSQEGGAIIRNFINSVPIQKINQLKQQSENYGTYLKEAAKARANGKLSNDFENWYLTQQKLNNFTALDENGNVRDWNLLSAPEQESIHDITKTEFEKLDKSEYLGKNKARGADSVYYDLFGTSDEIKNNAIDASIKRMLTNPSGMYELEKMKNFAELTGQDYNKLVRDTIERENAMYLQPEEKPNALALKKYEESLANYRAKLAHGGDEDSGDKMRPFHASSQNNLERITAGFKPKVIKLKDGTKGTLTEFQQAQDSIMKKCGKLDLSKRTNAVIDALAGTDNAGGFAVLMGRNSSNKDGSSVFLNISDVDNLKSANEILEGAVGAANLGPHTSKDGEIMRNHILNAISPKKRGAKTVDKQMTHTGRIVNVEYNGGLIRTYIETDIERVGRMYLDVHKSFTDGGDGIVYENNNSNIGINEADMARAVLVEKQRNSIKTDSY